MRVLVIEDEPRVGRIVQRALEHDRHTVDVATDGADGLEQASSGTFDAVVLDVLLPTMNGLEVCRRLRARKVSTPILMLTARDAVEQRVEGLDAGADDYLTKPFAVAELQARVRALLRRHADSENEVLVADDLVLDKASHRVTRSGVELELSKREFELLEYLLRNKGRVLTRQQILDHVWGYDFDPNTNIVDIYVHYLRKKLEDNYQKRLLKTVRGIGYAIEAI
jgi:DNA-binding response OmpR family regulator